MRRISLIFNSPYTLAGLVVAVLSFPRKVRFNSDELAIVMIVRRLWISEIFLKGAAGLTLGNLILLTEHGPSLYEHELVHIRQYRKFPLIFPVLYLLELFTKGYRKNRFEEEAYQKTGNNYYGS